MGNPIKKHIIMKNLKQLFFAGIALLMILVGTVSCKEDGAKAVSLLPSNSIMVTAFNIEALLADANTTIDKLAAYMNDDDAKEVLEMVDTKSSVLTFATNNNVAGLIASIGDRASLNKFISDIEKEGATKSKEGDFTIFTKDGIVFAHGGNHLFAITSSNAAINVSAFVKDMLKEDKNFTFLTIEIIEKLMMRESDIKMLYGDNTDTRISATFITDINFEEGKTIMNVDILKMSDELLSYSIKPTGKYNKFMTDNVGLYLLGGIKNGDALSMALRAYYDEYYSSMSQLGSAEIAVIKSIVNSYLGYISEIDGEITLGVDANLSQATLCMEVKDNDILNIINRDLGSLISSREIEDNQYVISTGLISIYYGVYNNTFYVTNSSQVKAAIKSGKEITPNMSSTAFAQKLKNKYGGMELNIAKILSNPLVAMAAGELSGIPLLNSIDRIEAINESPKKGYIEIIMKDSSRNALEIIVNELSK